MNKVDFIGYLEDTASLNAESIISLNELILEFPYCQSTRMLLTLNLFVEKNIRYDSELKTTAVYVNNRGILRKNVDKLSTDDVRVVLPDEGSVNQENAIKEENEVAEDSLKQNDNTRNDSTNESKVEKTKAEIEDDAESIAEVKSILERHIYELELEYEQKNKKPTVDGKSTTPVKQKSDLINDFIKNEPSISRPKTRFYDPIEKAKESIVDNENIVSETLADIFYDQGYLLKAIKIYQKLSLKFPEKSSYFAALIKKAEKELES